MAPGPIRVEVPPTLEHWEAAFVAPYVSLARGWERQLDIANNDLFYVTGALTPASYQAWLDANGVTWVALPNAPLDYAAQAEARLLSSGEVPGLQLVWVTPQWQLWHVNGSPGLVSGPARLTSLIPDRRHERRQPGRTAHQPRAARRRARAPLGVAQTRSQARAPSPRQSRPSPGRRSRAGRSGRATQVMPLAVQPGLVGRAGERALGVEEGVVGHVELALPAPGQGDVRRHEGRFPVLEGGRDLDPDRARAPPAQLREQRLVEALLQLRVAATVRSRPCRSAPTATPRTGRRGPPPPPASGAPARWSGHR